MKTRFSALTCSVFPPMAFAASPFSPRRTRWRRLLSILGAIAFALVFLAPAWAKDGDLDLNVNPGVGAAHSPLLTAPNYYQSGKSLISGNFTHVGGVANSGIVRLHSDGSLDTSFTSPVTLGGYVYSTYIFDLNSDTSQILISGPISISSDAGPYYGLARLNHDGTVDTSFPKVLTAGESVTIAVQTDGKILVVGSALEVIGFPGTYYLLRLNSDGTVDTDYPMRSAPGAYVRSAITFPASGIVRLIGTIPRFSDPGHVDYTLDLSLDGSTVLWHLGDEVVNGPIVGIAFQTDGAAVIVGSFTQVYGTPIQGVARLLPFGGGLDPSFQVGSGTNGFVQLVILDTGNKPVLAGCFDHFNGSPCPNPLRLNYDGSIDTTFTPGTGADDRIRNMWGGVNGWTILGAFQSYDGSPRQCLARLNLNGSLNSLFASFTTAFTLPSQPAVFAVQASPQGIYLAGEFSGYGGKLHRKVARVKFNGAPDQSFRDGVDGVIRSMVVQPDGKILIAGHFLIGPGYVACTSLARLNPDGMADTSFKPVVVKADGSFPDLYMVDVLDNGQIIIGGDFAQIRDASYVMQPRTAFARLNADGSLDPTFNAQITIPGGSNIRVTAGGVINGLYAVAGYVFYDGSPSGFYTRLTSTGELDPNFGSGKWLAPQVNLFNGEVKCGTDTADGRVVIGGDFTRMIDGSGSPPQLGHLARFSANGFLDQTFQAQPGADGPVYSLERTRPGSNILIGGDFTSYNGVAWNYLARMKSDGSPDITFNPGAGPNGPVYTIQWDEYMRRAGLGGTFTTYQGVSRPGVALIYMSSGLKSCPSIELLLLN